MDGVEDPLASGRAPCRRAGAGVCVTASPVLSGVLEMARARKHVICGVGDGPRGYSTINAEGVWSGISADFCRALAAAVLGSNDAVKFRPVLKSEGFSPCSRARSTYSRATSP